MSNNVDKADVFLKICLDFEYLVVSYALIKIIVSVLFKRLSPLYVYIVYHASLFRTSTIAPDIIVPNFEKWGNTHSHDIYQAPQTGHQVDAIRSLKGRFDYGLNPEKWGTVPSYLRNLETAHAEFMLVKGQYQFSVCIYTDKNHIQNHIGYSSTAHDCSRKFRNFIGSSLSYLIRQPRLISLCLLL